VTDPLTPRRFLEALRNEWAPVYGASEAQAMSRLVQKFLSRNTSHPIDLDQTWPTETQWMAEKIRAAVGEGMPIQYALGECWFDDSAFLVDQSVLIPRPETEELLDWIRKDNSDRHHPFRILDIGTGSGVLAISLKKYFSNASVTAIDISKAALRTAEENATRFQKEITFMHLDFRNDELWKKLGSVDLIVSNPPYISYSESASMPRNVVDFEPGVALFVEAPDALLFYRLIATFAKQRLNPDGKIYIEIHEDRSNETSAIFHEAGFHTECRRDMQGKSRMIRGIRKI
jgi:release factor glutamine methyltransferase